MDMENSWYCLLIGGMVRVMVLWGLVEGEIYLAGSGSICGRICLIIDIRWSKYWQRLLHDFRIRDRFRI